MEEETLIPMEKYAAMKKLTLYQVLKMIKMEELKTVTREQGGKKVTFIVAGAMPEAEVMEPEPELPELQDEIDYKTAYNELRRDLDALRRDFEALKEKMEMGKVVL